MVTPLERQVLDDMAEKLAAEEVSATITAAIVELYESTSIPNAEQILHSLRTASSSQTVPE